MGRVLGIPTWGVYRVLAFSGSASATLGTKGFAVQSCEIQFPPLPTSDSRIEIVKRRNAFFASFRSAIPPLCVSKGAKFVFRPFPKSDSAASGADQGGIALREAALFNFRPLPLLIPSSGRCRCCKSPREVVSEEKLIGQRCPEAFHRACRRIIDRGHA